MHARHDDHRMYMLNEYHSSITLLHHMVAMSMAPTIHHNIDVDLQSFPSDEGLCDDLPSSEGTLWPTQNTGKCKSQKL